LNHLPLITSLSRTISLIHSFINYLGFTNTSPPSLLIVVEFSVFLYNFLPLFWPFWPKIDKNCETDYLSSLLLFQCFNISIHRKLPSEQYIYDFSPYPSISPSNLPFLFFPHIYFPFFSFLNSAPTKS